MVLLSIKKNPLAHYSIQSVLIFYPLALLFFFRDMKFQRRNVQNKLDFRFKKLSRANFIIKRLSSIVDSPTIKSFYFALFSSHIYYSNIIRGHISPGKLEKIDDLQNHQFFPISQVRCVPKLYLSNKYEN